MCKVRKSAFIIMALCIGFLIFGGGKISYIVFYMITGSIILSYVIGRIGILKIKTYQSTERDEYFSGDNIVIASRIKNKSIIPIPYAEMTDKTKEIISKKSGKPYFNFIMPLQNISFNDEFEAEYRGIYQIGPLYLKCTDLLGFFEWKREIYSDKHIKVYPRYYAINRLEMKHFSNYGTYISNKSIYEDNGKVFDIKKYTVGDSMRKVHWKLSAKKAQLQVKKFEHYGSSSVNILLDFDRECFEENGGRDSEERAVELVSTISYYSLKRHMPTDIYVNCEDIKHISGKSLNDFKEILNMLIDIKPDGNNGIISLIKCKNNEIHKETSVIIITGLMGKNTSERLSMMQADGYSLIVFYINSKKPEQSCYERLINAGVMFIQLNKDDNVKEVLESI